jgi:GNAT superfamily N-acetyltransferase
VNQLPSVAAVYEQMDRARRSGPLVTNFYPTPEKLQRWVDRGDMFSLTAGDVLFVLRRDRDFLHLSYVTSSVANLAPALRELVDRVPATVTADVLGKRDSVVEIAAMFHDAGFRDLCTLERMTRPGGGAAEPTEAGVDIATTDDAPALAALLDAALDRFAEQIPDVDEVRRTAAERKVLIVRSGTAIAGLLFYEVTGQSSLLRHWVVDGAYRDQRVGARLIRRYFADCKDVRRFLLWVISDNDNAIDRYRHYGYSRDGLIDQVLIRRRT